MSKKHQKKPKAKEADIPILTDIIELLLEASEDHSRAEGGNQLAMQRIYQALQKTRILCKDKIKELQKVRVHYRENPKKPRITDYTNLDNI